MVRKTHIHSQPVTGMPQCRCMIAACPAMQHRSFPETRAIPLCSAQTVTWDRKDFSVNCHTLLQFAFRLNLYQWLTRAIEISAASFQACMGMKEGGPYLKFQAEMCLLACHAGASQRICYNFSSHLRSACQSTVASLLYATHSMEKT